MLSQCLLGLSISFLFGNGGLHWDFSRYEVVEEVHSLWNGVSRPYRETIRAFLVYFQNEVR